METTPGAGIDRALDVLVRATEQTQYPRLPEITTLRVKVGTRAFSTRLLAHKLSPHRFKVTCSDDDLEFHKTDFGNFGDTAPIFRAVSEDRRVEFDGGFLRQMRARDGRFSATVLFRTWKQSGGNDAAAATVWVLVGGPLGIDFPDLIHTPVGLFRPWSGERGMRFTIGGAPALIRQLHDLPAFPKEKATVLAIARCGDYDGASWLRSVRVVLSFVFGMWLDLAFQYRVAKDGTILSRRVDTIHSLQNWDSKPPIQTARRSALQPIGEQLDTMLRRCEKLFDQGIHPEVAVRYLMADHDGIQGEIGDICSAIDSLAESKLIDKSKRRFINKKRFPIVKAAIDEFLRSHLPAEEQRFRQRVGEVLDLARTESTSKKRERLWVATSIRLGEPEYAALDHRNKLSHKGYIPFDYSDDAQWTLLFKQSGLLRTLANRALLSILGFQGSVEPYHGAVDTEVIPARLNERELIGGD